jgi:formylaminopyrimidine deformylase / aminopyrimidine aminohydrolase
MADIGFLKDAVLVRDAGPRWDEATHSPFLDALASGTLPAEPFRRWLAQDYLFARALMSYQATLLAKAPRDAHNALVAGLAALDSELAWFEGHASRLQVDLAVTPHPVCRRYGDTWTSCSRPSTGTHIQCCRLS